MLLYLESTLQLCSSRRFCEVFKEVHFSSLSAIRTKWYSVRTLISQQHPSGRRGFPSGRRAVQSISRPDDVTYCPDAHQTKESSVRMTWIPVQTFLCVEKLQPASACIRLDDSAARSDDPQCSNKLQDFFPNTDMERLLQPSGRSGFLSGRAHP
jgi:hypothetical protein